MLFSLLLDLSGLERVFLLTYKLMNTLTASHNARRSKLWIPSLRPEASSCCFDALGRECCAHCLTESGPGVLAARMSRRFTPDLTPREAAYLHTYKPQGLDDVEAGAADHLDSNEDLVIAAATAAYNVWRAVALSVCGIGGLFFLVFVLRSSK